MKIYVDGEMPKSCGYCHFCHRDDLDLGYWCITNESYISDESVGKKRLKDCPLHPVAEREAEVRKEVVGEIKELAFKHFYLESLIEYERLSLCDCSFTADTVVEFLNQVERREK